VTRRSRSPRAAAVRAGRLSPRASPAEERDDPTGVPRKTRRAVPGRPVERPVTVPPRYHRRPPLPGSMAALTAAVVAAGVDRQPCGQRHGGGKRGRGPRGKDVPSPYGTGVPLLPRREVGRGREPGGISHGKRDGRGHGTGRIGRLHDPGGRPESDLESGKSDLESGKEGRPLSPYPPGSGKGAASIGTRNGKRNLKCHSAPAPLSWASVSVGTSTASRLYAAATCTALVPIVAGTVSFRSRPGGLRPRAPAVLAEFAYSPQEMTEGAQRPGRTKNLAGAP
jgi:hypothetical protein